MSLLRLVGGKERARSEVEDRAPAEGWGGRATPQGINNIMSVKIQKKGKESSHSLVYRFTKAIQESGILVRARKTRFKDRNLSEEKKKRAALRREDLKKQYEKLKKLGKV